MPPRERQRPNIGYDRSGPGGDLNVRYDSPGPPQDRDDLGYLKYDRPFFRDLKNKIKNQPGTGELRPNVEQPWNNPGPASYWNASLQSNPIFQLNPSRDNSGIMAAMTDTSPDFRGNWLFNNKFGNMFGNFMLGRHGDKISPKYKEILEEAFGQDGGISAFGGKLRPIIGDDGYGFNWKIGLGG